MKKFHKNKNFFQNTTKPHYTLILPNPWQIVNQEYISRTPIRRRALYGKDTLKKYQITVDKPADRVYYIGILT